MEERTIIQSGDGSKKDRLKKGEEFSVDESRAWHREIQKGDDSFLLAGALLDRSSEVYHVQARQPEPLDSATVDVDGLDAILAFMHH